MADKDIAGARAARGAPPFARVALVVAAVIALVAVGAAVLRGRARPAPPAAAAAPAGGDIRSVVASLEARMKANPADPEGWRLLGLAYFETARYGDAARAYEHATLLKPGDATLWSALGEARVLAGDGGVNPGAGQAFDKAVALDPKDPRARYFLAVRKDMAGDHKGAVDAWLALLKDTPAGAPWEESVRRVTQQVATANHIDLAGRLPAPPARPASAPATPGVATDAIPGPSREQMMAASSLPPGQQDAMVRGMVDGLAARLKRTPGDTDGWIRLMRARMVLGDAPAAAAALGQAKAANPAAAASLTEAARTLGVPGA